MQKPGRLKALPGEPPSDYVVDFQVGFLMRVAMQRHTSIFRSSIMLAMKIEV